MKLNTKLVVTLIALFFYTISFSQDVFWEVDLEESLHKVGWIEQANDGTVIASGSKGLMGLNPRDGSTNWHLEKLKGIDRNTFINIDNLPIFYVDYEPTVGATRGVLVNSNSGEILFDTKDTGARILSYTISLESKSIIFELLKGKMRQIMFFDLETWEPKWFAELGEMKGLVQRLMGSSFIDHGPIFLNNGNMIIGLNSEIYSLNTENGAFSWKKSMDKNVNALVYSEVNNSLYTGIRKTKKLTILNPENGQDITPGKLKLKGTLIDIQLDDNGDLILVETEGFNLIDPKTNDLRWKKSYKIPYLSEVQSYKDKYLAIAKHEKDGTISFVDSKGSKEWDSKVKGYVYYANPTPKGVMYISTERSNILSYDDGKDVWDKDVKFNSIPAVTYDDQEDKVVLFENKNAYKFDLNTGGMSVFAEDVVLKDVKKSTPLRSESVKNGYFLYDPQHLSLLSREGKLEYSKYFIPLKTSDLLVQSAQLVALASGLDIDVAGEVANIQELSAIANGGRNVKDQSLGTSSASTSGLYVGDAAGSMQPVFEVTVKRHFNSQRTKDHQFVVGKENKEGQNGIFMVNKNTGEIEKMIELTDKTPDYFIDRIDNVIFLNQNNRLISAYKM